MKSFETLWRWVMDRTNHGVMTVQERSEIEHVFNLMRDCQCSSYLEIGTAEGNSLYVLGHAVKETGTIDYVDYGEPHTLEPRQQAISAMRGSRVIGHSLGDSTNPETFIKSISLCHMCGHTSKWFDCILIDGGHDFATVLSDSILYAPLATKYVFWHDIQLPEVRAAYDWFKKRWACLGEFSEFIASDSFGYGILKVKQ